MNWTEFSAKLRAILAKHGHATPEPNANTRADMQSLGASTAAALDVTARAAAQAAAAQAQESALYAKAWPQRQ